MIFQRFDVRAFSLEVGREKPDKEIFEELVRQTYNNEIIYAQTKVHTALYVGINAFLYTIFEDLNKMLDI